LTTQDKKTRKSSVCFTWRIKFNWPTLG